MPTDKQKTCPHPLSEIVYLSENVTICNYCYGLLDGHLKLVEDLTAQEETTPEIVAA